MSYRKVRLVEFLRPHIQGTRVFDYGCGDGIITYLISNFCHVTGIDLDVTALKQRFPQNSFCSIDMADFNLTQLPQSDCLLLLDVLEHIPKEFETQFLLKLSSKTKKVIFNIPEISRQEQIIDRNIDIVSLITAMNAWGFRLLEFKHWRILDKEKYNFLVFVKEQNEA